MRVGLISDTHDRLPATNAALDYFLDAGITTLIHAGDIIAPFSAVPLFACGAVVHVTYGNNDGERAGLKKVLPQIQDGPLWVMLDGRRVLVHHYVGWCDPADVAQADIIVTGHTHQVTIEQRDGKLFANPGECCGWQTGRCTIGVLDTESLEVEIVEVQP